MKNLVLLFVVLLINVTYGQDFKEIVMDDNFRNLLLDFDKLTKHKVDSKRLKELKDFKISSEDDLKKIYIDLGFESYSQLEKYLTNQDKRLKILNDKFGIFDFSESDLNNLVSIGSIDLGINQTTSGTNCARKRSNCRTVANSSALVGHMGCASLDVTVILGLICHGAVVTAHIAALDNCNLDYEDCIRE